MDLSKNQQETGRTLLDDKRLADESHPYKRVEQIGDATLYLGDCLDILPTLGKVDHVITDPPYSERTHKKSRTNAKTALKIGEGYRQGAVQHIKFDHISDDDFVLFCREALQITKRWLIMTCDHRHAALTFDWVEHIRLGVWVKIAPMPQVSGDRPGSGHESVLILHNEGRKKWNRGGCAAVWRHQPIKKATNIATEKPLRLIEDFVSDFTDQGETIIDPFMGSGTTGIACMNHGRKFIGIEESPEHFDISCERIDQAQRQGRLFE